MEVTNKTEFKSENLGNELSGAERICLCVKYESPASSSVGTGDGEAAGHSVQLFLGSE